MKGLLQLVEQENLDVLQENVRELLPIGNQHPDVLSLHRPIMEDD